MITVHSLSKYHKTNAIAITIGTFDGVHIGHRQILKRLINDAKDHNLQSTVLTFFPHPRMVLQKDADIKLLNTVNEKAQILESLGLDQLIIHPFTAEFSRLSAVEFVRDILVNNLQTKKIVLGYDHRFGRNRNANITDLIAFGSTYDFEVNEIPAQEIEAVSVSSTKIRRALLDGDIQTANSYLGYEYMLNGIVKKGKKIGRKLNFPTANLHIEESYKLVPKTGVYVVKSTIEGKAVHGMMNIGYNPTVLGKEKTIEIHFFNFDADLYGARLQIRIMERLRDEHKFETVDLLRQQLEKDKKLSLSIINK